MKFGKTQFQIRMNHQLKHTLLTLRQEISFQMRGDFKLEENKMLGVFLVFIYLDNVLDVQSGFHEYSKFKIFP